MTRNSDSLVSLETQQAHGVEVYMMMKKIENYFAKGTESLKYWTSFVNEHGRLY